MKPWEGQRLGRILAGTMKDAARGKGCRGRIHPQAPVQQGPRWLVNLMALHQLRAV